MQSIMAAIPLFTPSRPATSSPRTSLEATPGSGTPRLKRRTRKSTPRQSFAKEMTNGDATLSKEDEEDSEILNANGSLGDSVQLEQDEVVSASTPRATTRSSGAALSSVNSAGSSRRRAHVGRISEILDRADIGAEEPKTPEEPEEEDQEYDFDGFAGYRWAGDFIELQVKWKRDEDQDDSEEWADAEEWEGGKMTWEPERRLHVDAPEFLFEYWRSQGGRPENPTDPGLYEIFNILKHNKNRTRLLIEWVGYERSEASWVLRKDIPATSKDVVDNYFRGLRVKGRKSKKSKKRKASEY